MFGVVPEIEDGLFELLIHGQLEATDQLGCPTLGIKDRLPHFRLRGLEYLKQSGRKPEHFSEWGHSYFVTDSLMVTCVPYPTKHVMSSSSRDLSRYVFSAASEMNLLKIVRLSRSFDDDSMCLFTKHSS